MHFVVVLGRSRKYSGLSKTRCVCAYNNRAVVITNKFSGIFEGQFSSERIMKLRIKGVQSVVQVSGQLNSLIVCGLW